MIVWTTRASWPQGRASVEAQLEQLPRRRSPGELTVEQKVGADVYVDDRALRFQGDWQSTLIEIATRGAR